MWTIAVVLLAFASFGLGEKESPPQWSPRYNVRGFLMIPYAELREPFIAWYDSAAKRSRIDYYGGMVKTYQIASDTNMPYGTSLKIAPITTEQVQNSVTCLQNNGSQGMEVEIQSVLPDLTSFKYVGKETVMDAETSKYQYTETIGDKVNKYTIWIKYKKDLLGDSIAIPVKYEMKGYNTLLGSHYDHYYIDYFDYNIDEIDPTVFQLDEDMQCTSFPGPGRNHYATFNPMKEFIHPRLDTHIHDEFDRFKTKHSKQYADSVEHEKRMNVFRQNLRFIFSSNRRTLRSFSVGVNHLADRTDDELRALRGRRFSTTNNGADEFPYSQSDIKELSNKLPDEFDWRLFGAVTPVKDQSVCGSCWSFGTTGAVEGALFLAKGKLVRLSQQALIDCSWGFGNNGCDGGEDFRSYQWIQKHGIPNEEAYGGYLGQDGYCHIDNVTTATKISSYVNVTSNDFNALRLAIFKHGPISVAIDASPKSFSFYSHGVYYDPVCKNNLEGLDHAVLAVGYGILNGHKYWLVKNSWSNYWGNDGYILISARDNMCGVETTPTYVVI